jgi:hypothetical protein
MADPFTALGAAAAIEDFLTAASKIVKYCYGYVKKYRNAARKVEQLAREVRALVSLLTGVHDIIKRGRKRFEYLPHLGPLIDDLKIEALKILQGLPETPMNARKRFVWPFSQEHTEALVNALSDKQVAVNTAMSMENLKMGQKTLDTVEVLQRDLAAWTLQQQEVATGSF